MGLLDTMRAGIIVQRGVYLGTEEPVGEDPARTWEERRGRCYELCGYAVLSGGAPTGSVLVHGTIRGPERDQERIGHAWVILPDGSVWEPLSRDVFADEANWNSFANAIPERKYSRKAFVSLLFKHEHWGCYHTTEGRTSKDA